MGPGSAGRWSLRLGRHTGPPVGWSGFKEFGVPDLKGILFLLSWDRAPSVHFALELRQQPCG